jgi:CheY-like chemotaxis protein
MMPGRRILVVEDNPLNLKLVRDVLTAFEYEVVEAHSGEEGVELAGTCSPDLVLMDLQLPGIDGYEALRLLRQDPRLGSVPVVAVTAFAMKEDRERTAREGFDGYLGKPISVRALPAQVDEFLSNGRNDAG